MKKLLLAALAATTALATVPSAPTRAADTYRFAIVPKSMNNPYFDLARDGCQAEAKKLGNVQCVYTGPVEQEPAQQVQIIQDLITQGINGLAISVADAASVARVIRQARQAGIPVITFDADAPNSERQAYVGTDNVELGRQIATELTKLHPKAGTYGVISGGPAAQNLAERVNGVREVLKKAGWTEVGGSPAFCNDDSALGVQQMTDMLTANPNLDALVPVGGWPLFTPVACRNMINAHKQAVDSGKLAIVSADTLPAELDLLKEGDVGALVGQQPKSMGAKAMDLLLALKEGKTVDKINYVGLDTGTTHNVADFGK